MSDSKKTVLAIATAGTEAKLCTFLLARDDVARVYLCPGSAGAARDRVTPVDLPRSEPGPLAEFARARGVNLVLEGPEGPGVPAALRERGFRPVALGRADSLVRDLWSFLRANSRIDAWTMASPRPRPGPRHPQKQLAFECERDHSYVFSLS